MHVGIITYQRGHLKTWQILSKLITKPLKISLYAFPFIPRIQKKTNRFQDRPDQLIDLDIKHFCLKRNLRYIEVDSWHEKDSILLGTENDNNTPDVFLTVIAKIIPESFILDRIIINAHPGLLPQNRGVDAFKWSIINTWPIGVSLHIIDKYIDRGLLLHRINVPVLPNDTLTDVAERSYDIECNLQANFDYYLLNKEDKNYVSEKYPLSKKKIPNEMDMNLENIFLAKRKEFITLSQT